MDDRSTRPEPASQTSGSVTPEARSVGLVYAVFRRKLLILFSVGAFLFTEGFYTSRQESQYQSSCRLLIEQSAKVDASSGSTSNTADSYVHAQMQLLTSGPVLEQATVVLREINLKSLAESNDIASVLREKIKVDLEKENRVLTVSCAMPVATDSAAIVNAVVDAYRTAHLEEENQPGGDNLHFLQLEKDKHEQEVARTACALAEFKISHPDSIYQDTRGTNIVYLKLSKLSDQLIDAQAVSMGLEAKYAAALAKVPPGPEGAATVAAEDADVDISWVQSELSRINATLTELTSQGAGPTNQNVIEARATQTRLRQKLANCQRVASLNQAEEIKAQLEFSKRREIDLQKAVDAQKFAAAALNGQAIEVAHLTDQLKVAQKNNEDINARLKVVAATTELPPQIRVLDKARPATASTGIGYQTFIYAAAAGLLAGIVMSLCIELTDNRLRSPEEASGILGLPVLGILPQQRGKPAVDTVGLISHTDPMSTLSDGVRRVRAAIFAASRSTPAKTILVASPGADDGKSIFVTNLAIVMAQSGGRTLLIDANFRSPSIQKIFDLHRTAGLADVISGKLAAERAIRRTPVEGLEVLSCGTILRSPAEMLNGSAFSRLIDQLSERYQCILVDSPPVLTQPDSRILGAGMDLTLLVVRTGSTTRTAADQCLDQLLSVGSRVLGVVVNGYSTGRPAPRLRGALRSLEVLAEDTVFEPRTPGVVDDAVIAVGNKKMRSNVGQQVDVFD